MQAIWKNWCRLCGNNDKDIFIDILIKNEHFNNLSETIHKFFSISFNNFDTVPTKICQKCYDFMINLLDFSIQCSKVQEMYAELQFNHNFDVRSDLEILRQKYDLLVTTKNNRDNNQEMNDDPPKYIRKSTRLSRNNQVKKLKTTDIDNTKLKKIENSLNEQPSTTSVASTCYDSTLTLPSSDCLALDESVTNDIISESDHHNINEEFISEKSENEYYNDEENLSNNNEQNTKIKKNITTKIKKCKLSIENMSTIEDENPINNNEKPITAKITCEKCPKVFTLMTRYLIHLKNKHSIIKDAPKKVKQNIIMYCKICKKGFSNRGSYHLHLKLKHSIIQGPVIHTCHECNKDFKTSGALKSHGRIHLKIEDRIWFPCNQCNKKFSSEYICETHIRTKHHGEKPFICDQCGKTLTSKRSLYFHTFIHSENEPLQCGICSKLFTNELRLQVHMKTHSQVSVNCPICDLKLKNKTFLNHHMVTHSEEKNFKCTFCGNAFKRKKNLRTHMIIHTGLKPYECPFCNQSFANRSNCKKHQKHSHPEDLAALEATGKEHYSKNIPKLTQLQAMLDQMKATQ